MQNETIVDTKMSILSFKNLYSRNNKYSVITTSFYQKKPDSAEPYII